MPRWPANLLIKLFAAPRLAIGGAAATAEAFLPAPSDAPAILIAYRATPARARAARRPGRRSTLRRRLPS